MGVIRRARLAEEWSRSFCEDTRVHDSLRPLGLRLRFVPAATMVNHEDIGLGGCFSFIRRQLLTTRLHHRSWPAILALNLGSSLGLTLAPAVIALAILTGHTGLAWALAAAVAVYGAGMTVGLFGVHHALIGMARRRGARTPPFPWQIFLAAPLVPAIHLAALVSACFLRRATWRGIPYEVRGPGQPVRLLAYHPYRPEAGADRRPASLV